LGARYFDPLTSRFISPDPLLNPMDPKSLDAYMYANNNPVVFMDPTGLTPYYQGNTKVADDYYVDGSQYKTLLSMTPSTYVTSTWMKKAAAKDKKASDEKITDFTSDDSDANAFGRVKDLLKAGGDAAQKAKEFADFGKTIAQRVRAGDKVGNLLRQFRNDYDPVLHLLAKVGRNFFVKALAELFGNVAADALFYLSDIYNNFLANSWAGPDEEVRWQFAAEKATNVLIAGQLSAAVTDPVVGLFCTTGVGCGPAAVAQGAVTWGIEGITGGVTEGLQQCRYGGICPTPSPTPFGQS
jgi:hypothetical protein